ncbi:MAG: hypothetical protein WB767_17195 [Nocardioides sp.]
MYDMYPEWGPAKNRRSDDDARAATAVQASLDLRDGGGDRPDDN